jgi:hypothetical protein
VLNNLIFDFAGHYKFTSAGQILRSVNNIVISSSDSWSFSLWTRRTQTNVDQFMLNLGTTYATNTMCSIGYRSNNAFTFAFYNNDLNTRTQTDVNVWVHW